MDYSTKLYARAQTVIPGGVNSPVRAFKGVGGTPIFFKSGNGAYLVDVEGKKYIDYVGSWGPLIHGHAHPQILKALEAALPQGLGFGAPTEIEVEMAELAFEIYDSTISGYISTLRGFATNSYLTKGTFHRLADIPEIGWHPDWEKYFPKE